MKNFILVLTSVIASCAPHETIPDSSTPEAGSSQSTVINDVIDGVTGLIDKPTLPQVDVGWLPEYETEIQKAVKDFPSLTEIPDSEMATFCPGWGKMDKSQRTKFYSDLFYAITKPESSYKRLSWMQEDMGLDEVTGKPVRSEGLLQLSYQDRRNYESYLKQKKQTWPIVGDYCAFDFAKDKVAFNKDYEATKGVKSGSQASYRTVNDAYINLRCGVLIGYLAITYFRPISSPKYDFRESMGAYWAVMRHATNTKSYARVREGFVKRQPTCNIP